MSKHPSKLRIFFVSLSFLLYLFFVSGLIFLDFQKFFTGNKSRYQVQSGKLVGYSSQIHNPRSVYNNFSYDLEKGVGYSFVYVCIPSIYHELGYISVLVGENKIPVDSRRYHFDGGDLKRYQEVDLFEFIDFGKADRVKSINSYLVHYSMSSELFYVDDTRTYDLSVSFSEFNVDFCKSSALMVIEGAVAVEWPWRSMSMGERFLFALFALAGVYVIFSFIIYILYQGFFGLLSKYRLWRRN